jgi:hypothetical protein
MELTVQIYKGLRTNCLDNFYIKFYQHEGLLINEQSTGEFNLLYETMHDVQLLHACT